MTSFAAACVGRSRPCTDALLAVLSGAPAVAVLDLNLPDGSGLELIPRLRELAPDVGIVMLTMFDTDDHLFDALHAGASAFQSKAGSTESLISAIRHAAISPHSFTGTNLSSALHRKMVAGPAIHLSQREDEILQLLKLCVPVNDIALRLYISTSTAKTHISRLYEKLGVANRTQAVVEAMRLGLLTSGGVLETSRAAR
jgi:DNA-binding NarL/FixJ family response regulator